MSTKVTERDTGWNALKKSLRSFGNQKVSVGVRGTVDFSAPTTAALAAVHEFGSHDGKIPERSFLRSTFDKNEKKYKKAAKALAVSAAKRKGSVNLSLLGEVVRADVIDAIRNREIKQSLAASTTARKGDAPALIDTGRLIQSIESKVERA